MGVLEWFPMVTKFTNNNIAYFIFMLCLIIYINKLIAVLPWEIAMILEKLLNAHLCTCCFLKDALGETPRVRQIWTLSALKNKLSHSMWDSHPDNPSVCGLCKHCLCLHELQKPDYFGIWKYAEMLVIQILCTCSDRKSVWTHIHTPYAYYTLYILLHVCSVIYPHKVWT